MNHMKRHVVLRLAMMTFFLLALYTIGAKASIATSSPADSDGLVPVYRVCNALPGYVVGEYSWSRSASGYVTGTIRLDTCKMRSLGFGKNDRKAVKRHEIDHARGFSHYEGTPATNAAYYPTITTTGR